MKIKNINLIKEIRNINEETRKIFEFRKKDIGLPDKPDKGFLFSLKNKHENIEVIENGRAIKKINKELLGKL